jgi:hypothetical protein
VQEFDFIFTEPVAPPVIRTVIRTASGSATVFVEQGYTRLLIYYPDVDGTLLFDSDDPTDAATIINGDGVDEITVDLTLVPDSVKVGAIPLEATNTLGVTESDPTPFDVPRLRRGGGMMGGGALVGFGGL